VLPPFLIWKGKQHQSNWYTASDSSDTQFGWTYAYSDNDWTDNELGTEYIKAFDRATAGRTGENEYRLLIMDSHSSYISWRFIEFAFLVVLRFETERAVNHAYEEGAERPEEDAATYTHIHRIEPWRSPISMGSASVFRCNVQPVGDRLIEVDVDG
jgi:hypothetical protein